MKPSIARYSPVIAVAAACLLVGSTGGAVAGSLITGKQIKDNTVSTKDIKNRTVTARDLSPKTTKALTDTSPWETLPSGTTVSGRYFAGGYSGNAGSHIPVNIDFPGVAPTAPIGYGFGDDDLAETTTDPACTGSMDNPTAAAGHVCVYVGALQNLVADGVLPWDSAAQARYTFFINLRTVTAGDDYRYWGAWAYTAP